MLVIERSDKLWQYGMDICGSMLRSIPHLVSPLIMSKMLPLYGQNLMNI